MSERERDPLNAEAESGEIPEIEATAEEFVVRTGEDEALENDEGGSKDDHEAGAVEDEAGEGAAHGPGDGSERIDAILESLIFAAGAPVPIRRLSEILNGPSTREIRMALERLAQEYSRGRRGIHLVAVAGGYQFRTAPENAEWIRALLRERPQRLGRATLETLAIVAYRQPATRAEIEAIRGVDVDSAINSLLSKRLIKIAGRKETVGRPLMYATTSEFLEMFGFKDLSELPVLKEIGPVAETDDDAAIEDADDGGWPASAEDPEPGRDQLAAQGGGVDPRGAGAGERPGGDGAGDEGEPDPRPDHD